MNAGAQRNPYLRDPAAPFPKDPGHPGEAAKIREALAAAVRDTR